MTCLVLPYKNAGLRACNLEDDMETGLDAVPIVQHKHTVIMATVQLNPIFLLGSTTSPVLKGNLWDTVISVQYFYIFVVLVLQATEGRST